MERALPSATTPGQSGPGSNSNDGVLRIPQSSSITGPSPSDCLVSYPEHLWGVYPSAEKQSVYSKAPADWAIHKNAASNSEQVPKATPHKTIAIRPTTTHHKNYFS